MTPRWTQNSVDCFAMPAQRKAEACIRAGISLKTTTTNYRRHMLGSHMLGSCIETIG